MTAGVGVALLVLSYLLVFTILDHWVVPGGFGELARGLMLGVIALLAAGWIAWKVVRPYSKDVTGIFAALTLENARPELKSALLNFVDLRRSGRQPVKSIASAMEKQAAVGLSQVDTDRAVDRTTLMRLSYALLAVVILCCLYAVFSPKSISFLRPLTLANAAVATQVEFVEIKPGNVEVLAGSSLDVSVEIRGELSGEVALLYSTHDRQFVDEPITLRSVPNEELTTLQQFRATITGDNGRGILQDMTYRIVAGDASSDTYRITVLQPPTAVVDGVEYEFPEYMKLANREEPGGHIDAWERTQVTVHATANVPLAGAELVLLDDDHAPRGVELPMRIAGGGLQLTGKWRLQAWEDKTYPKFYRIQCRNKAGESDPDPAIYTLTIRPDLPPVVRLLSPKLDRIQMPANGIVPLLVDAQDPDFELRSLILRMSINGQPAARTETIYYDEGGKAQQSFRGIHEFDLSRLALRTGDLVEIHVEARDNNPGGAVSRSKPREIEIVDPVPREQAKEQAQAERREQQEQLDRMNNLDRRPDEPQNNGEASQDGAGQGEQAGEKGEPGEASENGNAAGGEGENGDQTSSGQNGNSGQAGNQNGGDNSQQPPSDKPSQGPADGAAQPGGRNRPAEDDEAAQELIERLRERMQESGQEQNGENANQDSSDNSQSGKSQSGKSGTGKPGQQSQQNSDSNSDASGQPDDSGDSKSPGEQTDPAGKKPSKNGDRSKGDESNQKNRSTAENGEPMDNDDAKSGDGKDSSDAADNKSTDGASKDNSPSKQGMEGIKQNSATDANGDKSAGNEKSDQNADKAAAEQNNGEKGEKANSAQKGNSKGAGQDADAKQDPSAEKNAGENSANGQKPGEQKPGEQKAGNQKAGDDKSADEKPADGEKGSPQGGDKADQQQGDNNKAGENGQKQDAGKPSNGQPADNSKDGSKSGEQPNAEQSKMNDGDKQPGDAQQQKSADGQQQNQPGDGESGEGKSGDSKSGDGKSGDGQSGDSKQGKSGDGKSGKQKSKDGQSGDAKSKSKDGKSGEGKSDEGKQGDGKSDDGKSGDGKSGGGESGKPGKGKAADGKSDKDSGSAAEGQGGSTSAARPTGGGNMSGEGSGQQGQHSSAGGSGSGMPDQPEEEGPNLDDTKRALDLALDELDSDIERGKVDKELLNKLGWSEDRLKQFSKRMREALAKSDKDADGPAEDIRERRFEELLKSLNVDSAGNRRSGNEAGDRVMEGVNTRRAKPPREYRSAWEAFRRRLSSGKVKRPRPSDK